MRVRKPIFAAVLTALLTSAVLGQTPKPAETTPAVPPKIKRGSSFRYTISEDYFGRRQNFLTELMKQIPVSFDFKETPLADALKKLMADGHITDVEYGFIDPNAKSITASGENLPLAAALDLVSGLGDTEWSVSEDTHTDAFGGLTSYKSTFNVAVKHSDLDRAVRGSVVVLRPSSATDAARQYISIFDTRKDLSAMKVALDADQMPIRTFITNMLDSAKLANEFDSNFPTGKTITVHAADVPLAAALDMATRVANATWEVRLETDGQDATKTKRIVRIGLPAATMSWFTYSKGANPDPARIYAMVAKNLERMRTNFVLPNQSNVLYRLNGQPETRISYTCGTTGIKTTMLVPANARKICPKCKTTYGKETAYCPKDGTKLTAQNPSWTYCPICGKRIADDKPLAKRLR